MTTFHIANFGCRATQADAAAIERQLLERGCAPSREATRADVVVINTCTVTANADSQARQAIRHFHAENPKARILVTGCYAQRAPQELAEMHGVTWVVGNSHQLEIPSLVAQATSLCASVAVGETSRSVHSPALLPAESLAALDRLSLDRAAAKILTGGIFEQTDVLVAPVFGGEADHTRPILKIQDGCDHRCSYCVIPFVRGRSRSLAPAQVIAEIRKLTAAGYKEVVLSGINLGSYGRDLAPRVALMDLLRRILDETPLARLRLSSIEPQDVTQDLVNLVASTDRLARHFHIPLQSGSDCILAAMHRWYRAAHYARKIELIHERIPAAAIGADVIAGFPGETEDDHRATLGFIERLPFSYLHVFSFSKRPGTAAEKLTGELPPLVIKRRSRELRALAEEKKSAFRASQVGSILRVLTLGKNSSSEDDVGAQPRTFGAAPAIQDCSPRLQTRGISFTNGIAPASEEAGYNGPWTAAISDNNLQLRISGHRPRNQFRAVRLRAHGAHLLGEEIVTAKTENRNQKIGQREN